MPGYWSWDSGRNDFIWVAGVWKVPPPGSIWVSGRWVRDDQGWSRVTGFWSPRQNRSDEREVVTANWRRTGPPTATPADDPGVAPGPDAFLVPGHYAPRGGRVAWVPGYWARERPGFDWVSARWVRRQDGWDFRDGYWVRDDGRHIVGRPPLNADPDAAPPTVVESRPAGANDPVAPALEPLPPDDGPAPAPRDRNAEIEVVTPGVVVRAPSVVTVPAPYMMPRGTYIVPPGYGPRVYDPLGVVPPFARRIIDRFVP